MLRVRFAHCALLLALVGLLLSAAPARAQELVEVWRSPFQYANEIACDDYDGSVWVSLSVSSWLHTVVHLAADGTELSGSSLISHPGFLSANSANGTCWVADRTAGEVVHLRADGSVGSRTAGFTRMGGISADSSTGSCWVSMGRATTAPDDTTGCVVRLNALGKEVWRSAGFFYPDVSADSVDGSCWVTDAGPDHGTDWDALDWAGTKLVHFGADGTVLAEVTVPEGRFLDCSTDPADGSVWAAACFPYASYGVWEAGRLLHFAADGTFLEERRQPCPAPTIDVDRHNGTVWVGEKGRRILTNPLTGEYYWMYTLGFAVSGADGSLWANDPQNSKELVHLARSTAGQPVPPVASFSSESGDDHGACPLTIRFTEHSTGSPTSWIWDFGDGQGSTEHFPFHTYAAAGVYHVTLEAENAAGSSTAAADVSVAGTPHSMTPSISASATDVAPGGTVALTASVIHTGGHSGRLLFWNWSDGGAGGAFSSPTTQNPTYAAAPDFPGGAGTITLTATVLCNWYEPWLIASTSVTLPVTSNPEADPPVAAFSTQATGDLPWIVTFTDQSTGATTWDWDFGDGATSDERNPVHSYAAAGTYMITLTVHNSAGSDSASLAVDITLSPHTLVVTTASSSSGIDVDGQVQLWASAADSQGHTGQAWRWSDGGAGGTFLPSANARNPIYVASAGLVAQGQSITLTVTATCKWRVPWLSETSSLTLAVRPAHTLTVNASAASGSVASGGSVALSASAIDSQSHTGLAWSWSDGGAGGTFLPSANVRTPTYVPPSNTSGTDVTVTLTATATCKWRAPWTTGSGNVALIVQPAA